MLDIRAPLSNPPALYLILGKDTLRQDEAQVHQLQRIDQLLLGGFVCSGGSSAQQGIGALGIRLLPRRLNAMALQERDPVDGPLLQTSNHTLSGTAYSGFPTRPAHPAAAQTSPSGMDSHDGCQNAASFAGCDVVQHYH